MESADQKKYVLALESISQLLYTDKDLSFSNKKEIWPVSGPTELRGRGGYFFNQNVLIY